MRLSLRNKLIVLAVLVQALMAALLVFNSIRLQESTLRSQVDLRMEQVAASLQTPLVTALMQQNHSALLELVHESRVAGELSRLAVYDEADDLLAESTDGGGMAAAYFSLRRPLEFDGLRYGSVALAISQEPVARAKARLLRENGAIGALAVLVSSLLLVLAGRWLTRHVRGLRAASAAWARGELTVRAPVAGDDEVGALARNFNAMADALENRLARLKLTEARFNQAERVAHLGHWDYEVESGALYWSDEAYRIFGLPPQGSAMTYQGFLETVPELERVRLVEAVRQTLEEGAPYSFEHSIRRPDGSLRVVHEQGEVDRDEHGRPYRMFGTVLDITARKEAEWALGRLNRLYAVLSGVSQAIVRERDQMALFQAIGRLMVDIGGLHLAWIGELEQEPQRVRSIAAYGPAAEFASDVYVSLIEAPFCNGPVGQAFLTGCLQIYQDIENDEPMRPWREQAARCRLRSVVALPLRQEGKVVATLALYAGEADFFSPDIVKLLRVLEADVSHALQALAEEQRRRHAEEELVRLNAELEARVAERTRALEAANRELESFSYSVSHDLRAPLRSIDGFSRYLSEQYAGQLDDIGRDYFARIMRASQRMGLLIDDLLKLSRIGRRALQPAPVSLSALAQAVLEELRQAEPARAVDVAIEPELTVHGDPQLLRIVLENLLGNAWKFTGQRPVAQIALGSFCDGDRRVVFVRDNGAGFDDRYAHKLFGAFQRLHGAHEFEGTGIGLATVARIVNRHGGRVWAEGKPGEGAVFYFTLNTGHTREGAHADAADTAG